MLSCYLWKDSWRQISADHFCVGNRSNSLIFVFNPRQFHWIIFLPMVDVLTWGGFCFVDLLVSDFCYVMTGISCPSNLFNLRFNFISAFCRSVGLICGMKGNLRKKLLLGICIGISGWSVFRAGSRWSLCWLQKGTHLVFLLVHLLSLSRHIVVFLYCSYLLLYSRSKVMDI